MAAYAIGDLQGCLSPLQRLLEKLRFDPISDRLWFCGDLINRGPASLATLRFVYALQQAHGSAITTVLGNHDLSLLAIAAGVKAPKRGDTIDDILTAPDRATLLRWLRQQPLLHHDCDLGFTLVHAGLVPQWDLTQAKACAAEIEAVLRGPDQDYLNYLNNMFGNRPNRWDDTLSGTERLRCITNIFTRIRFCSVEGTLSFSEKGPPGSQADGLLPWFQVPKRRSTELRIVFGHWAALGVYHEPGIYALDSGCVWGGRLSALRLDNDDGRCGEVISVSARD